MSGTLWTDEEDAKLRAEYAAEKSMDQIAKALGRTRNATLGRIHRLRLREEGIRPPDKFHQPTLPRRKAQSPVTRQGVVERATPGMPAIPPPRSKP